jgi:ABC-type transport system substrate-binding protein
MIRNNKWLLALGLLAALVLVLAACQPAEPEVIRETVEVVVEVTPEGGMEEEPMEEPAAEGECCEVYRVGIYEDPVTLNYWNYLGPGSSVWTQYALAGHQPSLFGLSDQRFDWVPSLAAEVPEIVEEGEVWTITVPMVDNAVWSDGESITAEDVVFTHNTCRDLKLTQNWPNQCQPTGLNVTAEVVDEFTVKYTFPAAPSLGTWQAGVSLAPILPEHFWGDTVAEASSFVEGVTEPEAERPADCEAEGLSDEEAAACEEWAAYDEAFTNARRTLYEADATGQPIAGGFQTNQWEPGAFIQREANANYYFDGATITEYEDGTWVLENPNGVNYQLYGDAEGEVTLQYVSGPHAPNVVMSYYGSQDAAFLALANGEVDYVLNPLGLSRGLKEQALRGENLRVYTNADYGLFYLAFNMRREPMSDPAFREAVDAVIDKEFVVNSVLAGVVFPMYSTMPPGNGFWYNPDVPQPFTGLTREERVNQAVSILTEAGWSWSQEPAWDGDLQDVVPGEGLTMPNGEAMPELTILGPGPAYDPIRATFNQWISEWMRELGMPVESELTGFNTILGPVFTDATFDMYILGWSLGNVAFPDYFEAFWHSRNDTATSGNFNTPGYANDEYDALVDEFMSTADLDRAQELVYEMQVKLAADRPYIPLFYKQVEDIARTNIVFPYTETLGGIVDAAGFQTDAQPLSK